MSSPSGSAPASGNASTGTGVSVSSNVLHCPMQAYVPQSEDFETYIERFELFVSINNISDSEKVKYLLAMIGAETYRIAKNVCIPEQPIKVAYNDLVGKLRAHFNPIRLSSVERIKLRQRRQHTGESIANYILALKSAAQFCDFGNALAENLRDQFIYGLKDQRIARRLLSEKTLTFDKATDLALAMETASHESSWMSTGHEATITSPSCSEVKAINKGRKSFQNPKQRSYDNKATTPTHSSGEKKPCTRCGRFTYHRADDCPAKEWKCFQCGLRGHVSKCCKTKKKDDQVREVSAKLMSTNLQGNNDTSGAEEYFISSVIGDADVRGGSCLVALTVQNKKLTFEVDSGAGLSVLSKDQWKSINSPQITKVSTILRAANGQQLKVIGEIRVSVNDLGILNAIVVDEWLSYPLMGRNWLDVFKPNWRETFRNALNVNVCAPSNSVCDELKKRYPNCFIFDSTAIKGYVANIHVKPDTVPVFQKAYPVPYGLRESIGEEINRLVKIGVLEPIQYSKWASPVVAVTKPNGEIRLCCDYKKTLNPNLLRKVYALPTVEQIFANLYNTTVYCVVDLKNAYLQLLVDSVSAELLTINTHLGLFKVKKLPYGVASASHIFQAAMDQMLKGIEGAQAYQDDVLISASSYEQCVSRVYQVFEIFAKHNVKVNLSKCQWFVKECIYLGHTINSTGIHPVKDKCKAISEAPVPQDASSLKAWLGLLNYYHHLIPNASTLLAPLNALTGGNVKFRWSSECQKSFDRAKELIINSPGVTFFDPNKPIIITTDASGYGVASVMAIVVDGKERPVFFHSATLSPAQRAYSCIEREALSIVVAVKRYHKFIFSRHFTINSDHKALQYIFASDKNIPAMTSAKLQRWAIFLSAYNYSLKYVKGANIGHADGLSRNPIVEPIPEEFVLGFATIDKIPISSQEVAKASVNDAILAKVLMCLKYGWPNKDKNTELRPYFLLRAELHSECGLLMRGHRVVVPTALRKDVLELLHEGHPGIVRSKLLARSYVWWPTIDDELVSKISECEVCQVTRRSQNLKTGAVWPKPDRFWDRIHIDFFEKNQTKYLILVDAFSGWMEVWIMNSTTSAAVISKLRTCFAQFGLPRLCVSDNGPPFMSQELISFFSGNGVMIKHSPPYHPKSNGYAERGVGVCKSMLIREGLDNRLPTGQAQLDNVLLNYRSTPRSNGTIPYEIVFRQSPNTRLSLLRPSNLNKTPKAIYVPEFHPGQEVLVNSAGLNEPLNWVKGEVVQKESPTTYWVMVNERNRLTHVDFLKPFIGHGNSKMSNGTQKRDLTSSDIDDGEMYIPSYATKDSSVSKQKERVPIDVSKETADSNQSTVPDVHNERDTSSQITLYDDLPNTRVGSPVDSECGEAKSEFVPRRSGRVVKPPNKLNL